MPSIMPQQVQGPSQGSDADHVVVERVVDMLIGTEVMAVRAESRYARYSGTRGRPADDFCDLLAEEWTIARVTCGRRAYE